VAKKSFSLWWRSSPFPGESEAARAHGTGVMVARRPSSRARLKAPAPGAGVRYSCVGRRRPGASSAE
jgi:hypothetical protein